MTFEQFETISLYIGVGTLMGFMFFIIWDLAKNEGAGKFATFILFTTLGLGLFGFILKLVISELLIA